MPRKLFWNDQVRTSSGPGGFEAHQEGCKCPMEINQFGYGEIGSRWPGERYVVNERCPLHGANQVRTYA